MVNGLVVIDESFSAARMNNQDQVSRPRQSQARDTERIDKPRGTDYPGSDGTFTPPRSQTMTEAEWLAFRDPGPMLGLLLDRGQGGGGRRCRLFACDCLRRIWPLPPGP